ncbi:isochorismatase family protein [Amycolatopsis sp. NPDC051045]|uniref:isochorismatase family protein n=1 Tax=Amycolatopsis sp. NPDC051045 TaxID=3156922 RepID=UPI0034224491
MSIPTIAPYPMPLASELPDNQVTWTVDPDRAVLLVHDLQRYFLGPFPVYASPTIDMLSNIQVLRNLSTERGMPVAFSVQPGGMSDADRGLLKDFWGPGMSREPRHRRVVSQLAPTTRDQIFIKTRYSAFHRTPLLEFLHRSGRDQLIICGVYAHIGCLLTACDAFTNDIQPFLVADAIADFTPAFHQQALSYAAQRCGVVLTTANLVASLGASGADGS